MSPNPAPLLLRLTVAGCDARTAPVGNRAILEWRSLALSPPVPKRSPASPISTSVQRFNQPSACSAARRAVSASYIARSASKIRCSRARLRSPHGQHVAP